MPRGRKRGGGRKTTAAGAVAGLQAYRDMLVAQRDEIDQRLSVVHQALAGLGGGAAAPAAMPARRVGRPPKAATAGKVAKTGKRGRGGRRPRSGSLKEFALNILASSGDVMSVKDVTAAVRREGYKTTNKTLDKSVGIALKQLVKAGAATKAGHGKFKAKG